MKLRDSLLTVILGAGAGLGGAFLYGALRDAPRATEEQPHPTIQDGAPSFTTVVQAARRSDFTDDPELGGDLELEQPPSEQRPRVGDDDDDVADEEWRARDLAKHEQEPVNQIWSKRAHDSFSKDFARLGANAPFEIEKLECRTSSCLAVLKYDNFSKARKSTSEMLHDEHMEFNCMRTAFVPEPQDREAEYRATVIFDCGADAN